MENETVSVSKSEAKKLALTHFQQFLPDLEENGVRIMDKNVMMEFRDWLKDNKITNLTTDGYTKDWKKTLAITAYAETKEQSKLIDEYIKNSDVKFKRIIEKQ